MFEDTTNKLKSIRIAFFKFVFLSFSSSDIDLVVHGLWNQPHPLWTIKNELVRKNIAIENDIKVLDKAAVSSSNSIAIIVVPHSNGEDHLTNNELLLFLV